MDERRIELERAEAERAALERAAKMLETTPTNSMYRFAWNTAARMIRKLKNEKDIYSDLKAQTGANHIDGKVAGPR